MLIKKKYWYYIGIGDSALIILLYRLNTKFYSKGNTTTYFVEDRSALT